MSVLGVPNLEDRRSGCRIALILVFCFLASCIVWHCATSHNWRIRIPWFNIPQQPKGRIGLLVGHLGSDIGASCNDGLREVDVNSQIANMTAHLLEQRGYKVDLLEEFDPRLQGYQADAFIALHADSCLPHLHGFKVTGPTTRPVPDSNKKLVECLWSCYESETGLARQPAGITKDMKQYHAFFRIDPTVPAAILEMGFLSTDRRILVQKPEDAARGIAEAVECLMERE